MFFSMLKISFIFVVSLEFINGQSIPACSFATQSKYLGIFLTESGDVKISPYKVEHFNNPDYCKYNCLVDDQCLAASYYQNVECSFYNRSDFNVDSGRVQSVYKWKPCDWKSAVEQKDGRCPGLFVRYYNMSLHVTYKYLIIDIIAKTTVAECKDNCVKNPICEAFGYNNSNNSCNLHQLWPHENVNETYQQGTDLYRWTCVPNFIENLRLPKTEEQPNNRKCSGYWDIRERNTTHPNIDQPGVYFHTQSFKVCLSECNAHSNCFDALFDVAKSMCVLPYTERSDPNDYFKELRFIHFQWICLTNNSKQPEMNEKEKNYINIGMKCVKLLNNIGVLIAEDKCGHCPEAKSFVKCQGPDLSKRWTVTDSCLVNQSFWLFPQSKKRMTIKGHAFDNVVKIYTQLTYFWIAFSRESHLKEVNFLECRRFSGARSSKPSLESDIAVRSKWFAFPPIKPFDPYFHVPINIVLTASGLPKFGCKTIPACTNILRKLQMLYFRGYGTTEEYFDIPYNFLIDKGGNIYEARGWHYRCAAVLDFNSNSLCFAYIGSLDDLQPPLPFLQSSKRLIEFAVTNNFVNANYTVYIHQDVAKDQMPQHYVIIIKEWYRYRGFIPQTCFKMHWMSLIANTSLLIFILIVALIITRRFHPQKSCKDCKFLHQITFKQIYPKKARNITPDMHTIDLNIENTVRCLINAKFSTVFSKNENNFIKLLKLWFLNKFIRSSSSLLPDSDLAIYLDHLKSYEDKMQVYEAMSLNYIGTTEDNLHIVFFCSSSHEYKRLENLLSNRLCICSYFTINFLSFSHLSFESP